MQIEDSEEVNTIMTEIYNKMENKDYYVVCSEDSIKKSIIDNPYSIKLINNGKIIAFFIVRTREDEKDICDYLNFTDKEKEQSVIMGNTIVIPEYRGKKLQSKMIKYIENEIVKDGKYKFAVCTIYPENKYSVNNFTGNGYIVVKEISKTFSSEDYEGNKNTLKRLILLKNI